MSVRDSSYYSIGIPRASAFMKHDEYFSLRIPNTSFNFKFNCFNDTGLTQRPSLL